jgi:transposase
MVDYKTKRAPQDANLVSLEEDYEVEYWTRKFGVTRQRLADAVSSVGHSAEIRHVRPKYACKACDAITQAPAPAMPTPRGRATPSTLAHLLVSKYCDHLPLYRQSEIYAREGVDLDRSTLCDWVGQAAWLLDPIVATIRRHVFAAE